MSVRLSIFVFEHQSSAVVTWGARFVAPVARRAWTIPAGRTRRASPAARLPSTDARPLVTIACRFDAAGLSSPELSPPQCGLIRDDYSTCGETHRDAVKRAPRNV